MPIIAQLTLPSGTRRVATEDWDDVYQWFGEIAGVDNIKIGCLSETGGQVTTTYGSIDFLPTVFEDDMPPPRSFHATISIAESSESTAVQLFSGVLMRTRIAETGDSISYDLRGSSSSVTVNAQAFNDTLANVFTWACDGARLNLTLNTTYAMSPSPAVIYTTPSSDTRLLDVLSDISKFFCHAFQVVGSTLYLIDMLGDRGSRTLIEMDFEPPSYEDHPPYNRFVAGTRTLSGSEQTGDDYSVSPVCHTTNANIDAALADIKTIIERQNIVVRMPLLLDNVPDIGEKISFVDQNQVIDLDGWFRARAITFNVTPSEEYLVVEGEGAVS